jgi:hypothetical protein
MYTLGINAAFHDPAAALIADGFGPARRRGGPLDQAHYDIASSLQTVL